MDFGLASEKKMKEGKKERLLYIPLPPKHQHLAISKSLRITRYFCCCPPSPKSFVRVEIIFSRSKKCEYSPTKKTLTTTHLEY
jgi:hypothetical protein